MNCNFDCFHCPYPDCINNSRITPHEQKIIKDAHGGWELEMIFRLVQNMQKQGIKKRDACSRIGIKGSKYYDAVYHMKREAKNV